MKKRNIRRVVVLIIFTAVSVAAGIGLYNSIKLLKSDNLKIIIAQRMAERTDMQVSIGGADLYLLKGARILLTDFSLRDPKESIDIKARKVSVGFSLLKLIQGKLYLRYVDILEPEALIRFDNFLKRKSSGKKTHLPLIKVVRGSFRAIYKEREMDFKNINCRLNDKSLKLNLGIPSGEAIINAKKTDNAWEGRLSIIGFDLNTLYQGIGGELGVSINFKMIDNVLYGAARFDCAELSLPLGGQPIENIAIDIRANGTKDLVILEDIALYSDTVNLSGNGTITGRSNKLADSILDLNMTSSTFSYEKLVSHLPVDRFTYWVHKAYFEMLRGGHANISNLKYKGPFKSFKDKEELIFNLYIKGDVTDVSYGSGYGPERITDVNGTVILENNELIMDNLSGMAGSSEIKIKKFYIPNIVCPGFDMFLNMDVDMPLNDFIYGWKAAITPEGLNDLLGKINNVGSGQIKGSVTYQKNITDAEHEMMCDATLCDGVFFWRENFLEDVDARVMVADFGKPLKVNLTGRLDNLPIEKLEVTMNDPFYERDFSFSIEAAGLPELPGFRLENDPKLILTGTGKDRLFKGTARVSSKGFRLFENKYKPIQGIFKGKGSFTGQLWPEFSFKVPQGKLTQPNGNHFDLELVKDGKKGTMRLKGEVNLYHEDAKRKKTDMPVRGGIQVDMAWYDTLDTTADIRLTKLLYPYYTDSIVLDGPIEMKGERLSTDKLIMVFNNSDVMVSGFLDNRNSHFVGDLSVTGLKIEESESEDGFRPPENFTAEVFLNLKDLDYMGISYRNGNVWLTINQEGLTFNSIDIEGRTSKINGTAAIEPDKGIRFDLDVDFRNQSLEGLLQTMISGDMFLRGDMRLYGHVNGTPKDMNGNLKFEAQKGHIQYFPLLSNFFRTLNLYKVFKYIDLNFGGMRLSYNTITSTFDINDNLVRFDDFYLDGNTIQISSMGKYDIQTKKIDALLGVQPLETVDRAISAIPVVGYVLTGKDNKLIFFSLKVTGDIKDPSFRIARRGNISEPVASSLLRILKLPETLVESPKEVLTPSAE